LSCPKLSFLLEKLSRFSVSKLSLLNYFLQNLLAHNSLLPC
jgi:hypothetical protein